MIHQRLQPLFVKEARVHFPSLSSYALTMWHIHGGFSIPILHSLSVLARIEEERPDYKMTCIC